MVRKEKSAGEIFQIRLLKYLLATRTYKINKSHWISYRLSNILHAARYMIRINVSTIKLVLSYQYLTIVYSYASMNDITSLDVFKITSCCFRFYYAT